MLKWLDDKSFEIGNEKITLDYMHGGSPLRSEDSNFIMMKTPSFLGEYLALEGQGIKKVLELGLYQGGSFVFLDRLLKPDRMVAVELSTVRIGALDTYLAANPGRTKVYYGTSQDDVEALNRIVATDFAGEIDLIVDDASHFYRQTKTSFETLFPRLRPGGTYIIEDWMWSFEGSYQDPAHPWYGEPSLANILIDLAEELSINNAVESITVGRQMITIRKTGAETSGPLFQGKGLRDRTRVLL